MAQKLKECFASGARLAWLIDPPSRTVAVYHHAGEPICVLGGSECLDVEAVVPGFAMPVSEHFRNVPVARWRHDRRAAASLSCHNGNRFPAA